jgi:hypothetical protein
MQFSKASISQLAVEVHTLAASTLIILLFSEMFRFSKHIFSSNNKNVVVKENGRIF